MDLSSIEIIFACPFIDVDHFHVHYSSKYNQKEIPVDSPMNELVEKKWMDAKEKNPRIWNQSKFRYYSSEFDAANNEVTLNLGFTDYKGFVTTNVSDIHNDLAEMSKQDWNDENAYVANPLGNQACVLTEDNYMILIQRSQFVTESKGRVAGPGGHPEPDYCHLDCAPENEVERINNEIEKELYLSILKEIFEETSIPPDSVYINRLIGFMRNKVTGGRQGMLFYCKTHFTKQQVYEQYSNGVQDQYESLNLVSIPLQDIVNHTLPELLYSPETVAIFQCLFILQKTYPELFDAFVQ